MRSQYFKKLLCIFFIFHLLITGCFKKKSPSDIYDERHPWSGRASLFSTLIVSELKKEYKDKAEYFFSNSYKGCIAIYFENKLRRCSKNNESCFSNELKSFLVEMKETVQSQEKSKQFFDQCDNLLLGNVKEMKDLGVDKELGMELDLQNK